MRERGDGSTQARKQLKDKMCWCVESEMLTLRTSDEGRWSEAPHVRHWSMICLPMCQHCSNHPTSTKEQD